MPKVTHHSSGEGVDISVLLQMMQDDIDGSSASSKGGKVDTKALKDAIKGIKEVGEAATASAKDVDELAEATKKFEDTVKRFNKRSSSESFAKTWYTDIDTAKKALTETIKEFKDSDFSLGDLGDKGNKDLKKQILNLSNVYLALGGNLDEIHAKMKSFYDELSSRSGDLGINVSTDQFKQFFAELESLPEEYQNQVNSLGKHISEALHDASEEAVKATAKMKKEVSDALDEPVISLDDIINLESGDKAIGKVKKYIGQLKKAIEKEQTSLTKYTFNLSKYGANSDSLMSLDESKITKIHDDLQKAMNKYGNNLKVKMGDGNGNDTILSLREAFRKLNPAFSDKLGNDSKMSMKDITKIMEFSSKNLDELNEKLTHTSKLLDDITEKRNQFANVEEIAEKKETKKREPKKKDEKKVKEAYVSKVLKGTEESARGEAKKAAEAFFEEFKKALQAEKKDVKYLYESLFGEGLDASVKNARKAMFGQLTGTQYTKVSDVKNNLRNLDADAYDSYLNGVSSEKTQRETEKKVEKNIETYRKKLKTILERPNTKKNLDKSDMPEELWIPNIAKQIESQITDQEDSIEAAIKAFHERVKELTGKFFVKGDGALAKGEWLTEQEYELKRQQAEEKKKQRKEADAEQLKKQQKKDQAANNNENETIDSQTAQATADEHKAIASERKSQAEQAEAENEILEQKEKKLKSQQQKAEQAEENAEEQEKSAEEERKRAEAEKEAARKEREKQQKEADEQNNGENSQKQSKPKDTTTTKTVTRERADGKIVSEQKQETTGGATTGGNAGEAASKVSQGLTNAGASASTATQGVNQLTESLTEAGKAAENIQIKIDVDKLIEKTKGKLAELTKGTPSENIANQYYSKNLDKQKTFLNFRNDFATAFDKAVDSVDSAQGIIKLVGVFDKLKNNSFEVADAIKMVNDIANSVPQTVVKKEVSKEEIVKKVQKLKELYDEVDNELYNRESNTFVSESSELYDNDVIEKLLKTLESFSAEELKAIGVNDDFADSLSETISQYREFSEDSVNFEPSNWEDLTQQLLDVYKYVDAIVSKVEIPSVTVEAPVEAVNEGVTEGADEAKEKVEEVNDSIDSAVDSAKEKIETIQDVILELFDALADGIENNDYISDLFPDFGDDKASIKEFIELFNELSEAELKSVVDDPSKFIDSIKSQFEDLKSLYDQISNEKDDNVASRLDDTFRSKFENFITFAGEQFDVLDVQELSYDNTAENAEENKEALDNQAESQEHLNETEEAEPDNSEKVEKETKSREELIQILREQEDALADLQARKEALDKVSKTIEKYATRDEDGNIDTEWLLTQAENHFNSDKDNAFDKAVAYYGKYADEFIKQNGEEFRQALGLVGYEGREEQDSAEMLELYEEIINADETIRDLEEQIRANREKLAKMPAPEKKEPKKTDEAAEPKRAEETADKELTRLEKLQKEIDETNEKYSEMLDYLERIDNANKKIDSKISGTGSEKLASLLHGTNVTFSEGDAEVASLFYNKYLKQAQKMGINPTHIFDDEGADISDNLIRKYDELNQMKQKAEELHRKLIALTQELSKAKTEEAEATRKTTKETKDNSDAVEENTDKKKKNNETTASSGSGSGVSKKTSGGSRSSGNEPTDLANTLFPTKHDIENEKKRIRKASGDKTDRYLTIEDPSQDFVNDVTKELQLLILYMEELGGTTDKVKENYERFVKEVSVKPNIKGLDELRQELEDTGKSAIEELQAFTQAKKSAGQGGSAPAKPKPRPASAPSATPVSAPSSPAQPSVVPGAVGEENAALQELDKVLRSTIPEAVRIKDAAFIEEKDIVTGAIDNEISAVKVLEKELSEGVPKAITQQKDALKENTEEVSQAVVEPQVTAEPEAQVSEDYENLRGLIAQVSAEIEKLREQFNSLESNAGLKAEQEQLVKLIDILMNQIPGAIIIKNRAFMSEKEVVSSVVNSEVESFKVFENKLTQTIPEAIDKKNEAFKEEVSVVKQTAQDEADALDPLEQVIQSISSSLNFDVSVSGTGSLSNVIRDIRSTLDSKTIDLFTHELEILLSEIQHFMSVNLRNNNILTVINSIVAKTDDLQRLIDILQHSEAQINAVNNAVNNATPSAQPSSVAANTSSTPRKTFKPTKKQIADAQKQKRDQRKQIEDQEKANNASRYDALTKSLDALTEARTKYNIALAESIKRGDTLQAREILLKDAEDKKTEAINNAKQAMLELYKMQKAGQITQEQFNKAMTSYKKDGSPKSQSDLQKAKDQQKKAQDKQLKQEWEAGKQEYLKNQIAYYNELTEAVKRYVDIMKRAKAGRPEADDATQLPIIEEKINRMTQDTDGYYYDSDMEDRALKDLYNLDDILDQVQQKMDRANTIKFQDSMKKAQDAIQKYYESAVKLRDLQEEAEKNGRSTDTKPIRNARKAMLKNKQDADNLLAGVNGIDSFQDGSEARANYASAESIFSRYGDVKSLFDVVADPSNAVEVYHTLIKYAEEYVRLTTKQDSGQTLMHSEVEEITKLNELYDNLNRKTTQYANNLQGEDTNLPQELANRLSEAKQTQAQNRFENVGKNLDKFNSYEDNANLTVWLNDVNQRYDDLKQKIDSVNWSGTSQTDLDQAKDALRELSDMEKEVSSALSNDRFVNITDKQKNTLSRRMAEWASNNSAAKHSIEQINELQQKLQNIDDKGSLEEISNEFEAIKRRAYESGEAGKSFGDKLKTSFGNLGRYLLSFVSIYKVIDAIKQGVSIVKELDSAMTNLRKVIDDTDDSFANFSKEAFQIAERLGSTASSIIDAATEWGRLGYNLEDSAKLGEASVIYANVGDMDATTASNDLVSALKAYNKDASEAMHVVDILNEIGKHKLPNIKIAISVKS